MKCTVKSDNERNPYCQLQVSGETAVVNTEEGGDDVKSAWSSDDLGDTRATMAGTMSFLQTREGELISKKWPQFRLKAATRLHEVGIASNGRSATLP